MFYYGPALGFIRTTKLRSAGRGPADHTVSLRCGVDAVALRSECTPGGARRGEPKSLLRALQWLHAEARATRPIFLFFLTRFLLVLLIVKLSLAQYSIGLDALPRALLGAALAAKVILLLENTPIARPFNDWPRIVPILFKSIVRGKSEIVLGFLERVFDRDMHRQL
jgi:hypothetical protein